MRAQAGNDGHGTVLVVDDSRLVRAIVVQALTRGGYGVAEAQDGPTAMRLLATREFDVLITDLRMPNMDGLEVLAKVKQQAMGTEVIILTGSYAHDVSFAVRALRLGAHDYQTKPIRPEELLLTVERAVEKKRLRDANARLLRELEALSRTDALTGAGNRRAFEEALMCEHARAQRYAVPLSLVIFDIDHFKRINDVHGHPGGDAVLKGFVSVAQSLFRESDTLFRIGGEEFAVLLPHTACQGAMEAAQRLVTALAQTPMCAGRSYLTVTCSAGFACVQSGEAPETLVSRADAALYRAKAEGRNRVAGPEERTVRLVPQRVRGRRETA
jgi:diguanylate cyclase (GGDEF)-like protein